MNLINIMMDKSDIPAKSLTMGDMLGLWNTANNKIITLPVYVIYSKQAKDKDLLQFVNKRIDTVRKQIGRIQQFFKDKKFDSPREPNWDKKLNNEAFVISGSLLDDEEIAMGMKEHIKAVLSLETEALRDATTPDTRGLLFDLIKDGQKDYGTLIKLMREKKWSNEAPEMIQQ